MSAILITKDIAYPAAALVSTFWLTVFQTVNVGRARGRAKIPYPQLYAEKAEAAESKEANKFNCAQRAHQNTLEYLPLIITGTLITSLKYPILAAAACGTWAASRFVYTIGYSSGDPAKRNNLGAGLFGMLSWITLLGASTWTVVELVRAL
ncbi:membrane-associated proteins in eicosanoid and glutathione metabolism [Fomitopsis schrenkii]|uniref:Membrane-associated proteins in eicosanoid and glutathione metabolism n=1 Tax=Fomitopsis schrenkii TaxID=2126942 RepID=S8E9B1_FOMSC|nr:membrane-associated proteins in eicosanoid and glutathione metabolism [Fomitopsis schrenkii]